MVCFQVNGEARRNQLMRDMAQLRLKAEVSELEGSLKQTDAQPKLPPYLVPDALSLCEHLNLMKQLAACSKFIIIIPVTGRLLLLLAGGKSVTVGKYYYV